MKNAKSKTAKSELITTENEEAVTTDIAITGKASLSTVQDKAFTNEQMNLFQAFIQPSQLVREDLSNAIEFWDSIPKYSSSPSSMKKVRKKDGFLPVLKIGFKHEGMQLSAVVRPARIETKDGNEIELYPTAREEFVEHALRKIAAEQYQGYFDQEQQRSGVRFSLHMLREELKRSGHTMSYYQLTEALFVLAYSNITIKAAASEKDYLGASPYLAGLTIVKRADLEMDASAKWTVVFHPLVTKSIDALTYRQFNYTRLMACKSQLSRWLIQYLTAKYNFASYDTPFTIKYSTVKRDSALLNGFKEERQAIDYTDDAFEELKTTGIIMSLEKDVERGKFNKIEDVSYSLIPTSSFIAEQKAANKRKMPTENQQKQFENR